MKLSRGVYLEAFLSFQKRVLYASPADWLVDFRSGLLTARMGVEMEPEANEEYPMLHIHEVQSFPSECQDGSVRCVVLEVFKHVSMQRVSMEWSLVDPHKHSWKAMSLAEQNELNRHLTTALGSSYALHRGAVCHAEGYCASGLVCQGVCQLQELETSDCASCEELNNIFKHMSLIVTSSGGGGHLVAAKNLQQELLEEHEQRLQRGHELLAQSRHLLSKDVRVAVEGALEELLRQPPVQLIDLMKSPCTNFGLIPLGDFMSEQWNRKQRAGDIKGLKLLVKQQPWTQVVFGAQCESYMAEVFAGNNAFQVPPTQIYTVQPLLLESLLAATPPDVSVELFMTDLPTAEAVHFFQPLLRISEKLRGPWKDKLILHSLPAALGGADELERLSGVPQQMTKLEKFMPVNQAFKRPQGLPSPKEMVALKLKAQLPAEERFLSKLGNPLVIQEQDEVILVMLGSQPTASAVKAYAKESLKLPIPAQKRYVLLACGKPTVEDYAELYQEVASMGSESHTVLVPFTGQDAKEMLGRADMTITRSGGLTAGELLALRSRASDRKRVLLHVEPVDSGDATRAMANRLAEENPGKEVLQQAFRDGMLEGMVPWEAGNARYLVTAAGADLVTPETFVKAMAGEEAQHFEVDWQLLLKLRGFGADEIAFATAFAFAHECESRAVCERGIADLPVEEDLVDEGCRTKLQRFSDPLASGFRNGLNFIFGGNNGLAKWGDQLFQYQSGRFSNSHRCHGAAFLVRRRSADLETLAADAVEACGAQKTDCGDFLILELPASS